MNEEKENLETCKREREEYLNGWKRAKADLLNYKREESERLKQAYERGEAEVIGELVSVADGLDESLRAPDADIPREGIELIRKQLSDLLKRHDVAELAPRVGEPFDPRFHEAIAVEAGGEEGTIMNVARPGYAQRERLLRPAQVVVAKRKEDRPPGETKSEDVENEKPTTKN